MGSTIIYMIIALTALVLIIFGLVFIKKKSQKPSHLLNAALIIIVLSMFFDERIIAYPLMGLGVGLAIIDAIMKKSKKK